MRIVILKPVNVKEDDKPLIDKIEGFAKDIKEKLANKPEKKKHNDIIDALAYVARYPGDSPFFVCGGDGASCPTEGFGGNGKCTEAHGAEGNVPEHHDGDAHPSNNGEGNMTNNSESDRFDGCSFDPCWECGFCCKYKEPEKEEVEFESELKSEENSTATEAYNAPVYNFYGPVIIANSDNIYQIIEALNSHW